MTMTRRSRWLVVAGLFMPSLAAAQMVRGIVVDPSGRPMAGVVVVLIDADSKEAARAFSDEKGEYRLLAPRGGGYRVRTMRIGYRAETSPVVNLDREMTVEQRMALTAAPFGLDTLRVTSRNVCKLSASDSALSTYAVWEQVRAALTAAELTRADRGLRATTVGYRTSLDPVRLRVQKQDYDVSSEFVRAPWRSRTAAEFHRSGYVIQDQSGAVTYHAPGLEALLAPEFLEDHCLKMTSGKDASRIGIAFEPTSERANIGEIKGTIWLDRKSAELRSLDYKYTNLSKDQEGFSDGAMEFAALRNGMWAITKWSIRMPSFAALEAGGRTHRELRVDTVHVYGGELSLVMSSRGDTLWSRPPVVFQGVVVDSAGRPVGGATIRVSGTEASATADRGGRFALPGLIPGGYRLSVRSPSLDSVNTVSQSDEVFANATEPVRIVIPTARQTAATVCRAEAAGVKLETDGIIIGDVAAPSDSLRGPAVVVARWSENGNGRTREVRVDARGMFRVCGAPVNATVSLRAHGEGGASPALPVRLSGSTRFTRVSLSIDPAAQGAVFEGTVVMDSTNRPIDNAEVILPRLGLSTRTNDRGEFRIEDIVPGRHEVVVRRVGFGQLEASLEFAPVSTVERRVVLGRVTLLEPVTATAYGNDQLMRLFDEHRLRGLGAFRTRADLEKIGDAFTMAQGTQQMAGAHFTRSRNGPSTWITGRQPVTVCRLPDGSWDIACLRQERLYSFEDGAPIACYALVFLDRTQLNRGRPTQPFDLHSIGVNQIEALEWYPGDSGLPPAYQAPGSQCGVLILHSRRPSKK